MKKTQFALLLVFIVLFSQILSAQQLVNKQSIKILPYTATEKEWADSIIEYMPLVDMVTMDSSFLIKDFHAIEKAKNNVPWSKKVPSFVFYHYILPYRVSQEPLNNFRISYTDTLLKVIKNARDMRTAVLKIDDWVTVHNRYKPTAPWDQSPVVTLKRGYGRCEEMATLLIMALRSVYIPARFVYTPWWPYTNSNHAWVEVWINGKWEYIGKLKNPNDWVVSSTKRTAVVAGSVWGKIEKSDEPVLNRYAKFTIINSTPNYENVKLLSLKITDDKGKPVPDAHIYLYVYNYSAFRYVATGKSDSMGHYNIKIGKTDLIVTAAKNGKFAWAHVGKTRDTVSLVLSDNDIPDTSFWFETIPPVRVKNKGKKYVEPDTVYLAQKVYLNSLNPASEELEVSFPQKNDSLFIDILKNSFGNYPVILNFYNHSTDRFKDDIVTILRGINENKKDLVSVDSADLSSLLRWYETNKKGISVYDDSILFPYIISPRVYFEDFGTYKDTFSHIFAHLKSEKSVDYTVKNIIDYVNSAIDTIPDTLKNRFGGLMNPIETYRIKRGRPIEKYILAAGILRSLDIPARLNYMDNGIEYFQGGKWKNMMPLSDSGNRYFRLKIVFRDETTDSIQKMRYYYDFTINKIGKNRIIPLDLDVADGKDTIECDLLPGNYFLIDGWRNLYGSTYLRIKNFNLGEDTTIVFTSGIPLKDIKTGNIVVRKFSPPKTIKIKDIHGTAMNWDRLKKGANIVLILDMHSESSIATVNRLKPKNLKGNVYIFANGDIEPISKKMSTCKCKYRIFKLDNKTIKKIFRVKTFPSILVINKGKTTLWVDGYNPDLLNMLE